MHIDMPDPGVGSRHTRALGPVGSASESWQAATARHVLLDRRTLRDWEASVATSECMKVVDVDTCSGFDALVE